MRRPQLSGSVQRLHLFQTLRQLLLFPNLSSFPLLTLCVFVPPILRSRSCFLGNLFSLRSCCFSAVGTFFRSARLRCSFRCLRGQFRVTRIRSQCSLRFGFGLLRRCFLGIRSFGGGLRRRCCVFCFFYRSRSLSFGLLLSLCVRGRLL